MTLRNFGLALVLATVAFLLASWGYLAQPATPSEISAVDPSSCEGALLKFDLASGPVRRTNLVVDRYVCRNNRDREATQRAQQAALDGAPSR